MADLTEQQSSIAAKITGSNSYGVETNYVNADTNGGLIVAGEGTPGSPLGNIISVQVPDTTISSSALGALNANIQISMAGSASVGFQINAGTLIGTIAPQCSVDGGTTWVAASFYDSTNSSISSSITFSSANTLKVLSILPIGGASHVRVIVTAYTSGTANALLRASQVTGAVGALTSAAFGTITNTSVTVPGNTATLILAANTNRKYAYISNGSGSQMNIQFGSSTGLSATLGLAIPSKSFYELKGDNLYTGTIYAFCAGNITVSVSEGTP